MNYGILIEMMWKRVQLTINEEAEDIVISALADAGVQGVEIEDSLPLTEEEIGQMFVDIPPEKKSGDGTARLVFYLDPDEVDVPEMLARVTEELEELRAFCDIGSGEIKLEDAVDTDWESEWKKYFQPFWIDDIYVVPSWVDQGDGSFDPNTIDKLGLKEPSPLVTTLCIDPGTAFGTGMHETTQLCIRQMRKVFGYEEGGGKSRSENGKDPSAEQTGRVAGEDGPRVLDIGTGSGILGILAWKLGARSVLGTDLDPVVKTAVRENCEANGVPYGPAGFLLLLGDLISDAAVQTAVGEEAYDIVFSNILADVLVRLAPAAAKALAPGGVWITSGILEGKEREVARAAEDAGLHIEEITQQGEWMSVTARKV